MKDMQASKSQPIYEAVGFWFPCGPANFYNQKADATLLIFDNDAPRITVSEPGQQILLQSSVFSRSRNLRTSKFGYESSVHIELRKHRPINLLFRRDVIDTSAARNKDDSINEALHEASISRLHLLLNEYGFVVLVGEASSQANREVVQKALVDHLADICDGNLKLSKTNSDPSQIETNIKDYRLGGILTFFQLNTIVEGIYNAAFHPGLYFETVEDAEKLEEIESEYSIGKFIASIACPISLPQEKVISGEFFEKVHNNTVTKPDLDTLVDIYLSNEVEHALLANFLEQTSSLCLLRLKWRIEQCRRALLQQTMSILQRKNMIQQIENPDEGLEIIGNVTEIQLRGYVMLIAAKLPLITNISRYINELVEPNQKVSKGNETVESHLVRQSYMWTSLAGAIQENIDGLNSAIELVWRDRLLYEEEQVRAEQEALAELERSSSRSPRTNVFDSWIFVITLAVAVFFGIHALDLFGTALPINSTVATSTSEGDDDDILNDAEGISGLLIEIGITLTLMIVVYMTHRVYRVAQSNELQFYEIHLRLDRRLNNSAIELLLGSDQRFSVDPQRWHEKPTSMATNNRSARQNRIVQIAESERTLIGFDVQKGGPYRVERVDDGEATYKLHSDVDILLLRNRPFKFVSAFLPAKVGCHIVGEIYYHRPKRGGELVYRELRLVSNDSRNLNMKQILEITSWTIERFVNPYVESEQRIDTSNLEDEPSLRIFNSATFMDLRLGANPVLTAGD